MPLNKETKPNRQDTAQGQFLSEVQLVWILFSFFYSGCPTKAKKYSLPYYLPLAGIRSDEFIPFPKGISTKWNNFVRDLNSSRWFHLLQR